MKLFRRKPWPLYWLCACGCGRKFHSICWDGFHGSGQPVWAEDDVKHAAELRRLIADGGLWNQDTRCALDRAITALEGERP